MSNRHSRIILQSCGATILFFAVCNEALSACAIPCGLDTQVTAQVAGPSSFPTQNTQGFADGGPHQISQSLSGFVGNDPALAWRGDASASASATFGTLHVAGSISTAGTTAGGGASASSSSTAEFDDVVTFFGPLPSPTLIITWAVNINSVLPSTLANGAAGWDLVMLVGTARGNTGVRGGETVNSSGRTGVGFSPTAENPMTLTATARIGFGPTPFHFVLSGHTEGSGPGADSFYDVSLTWAGISALTDNGVPVPIAFTSASGTDWRLSQVAAVPEPSNYAMMLAGLALVGFIGRRNKRSLV